MKTKAISEGAVRKTPLRKNRAFPESIGTSRARRGPSCWITTSSQRQVDKLAHRDGLVLEHLRLAKTIALSVHSRLPMQVDLDDLVQIGVIGLFDAASKFDATRQEVFSRYAKHRIKGAILDSLRQLDWVSRDIRRKHKQVAAAKHELTSILQREPTEVEVAQKLGMDVDRLREMMLDLQNMGPKSTAPRDNQSDDLPPFDFPGKSETRPDFIYVRTELRSMLGEAIKTLPSRYQRVVQLYYNEELTMKGIGVMLGINESRVSQVHKSALEKMALALHHNGVDCIQAFHTSSTL